MARFADGGKTLLAKERGHFPDDGKGNKVDSRTSLESPETPLS